MKQQTPLVALAIATVGSIGGTRLSAIAIPWLVLSTTNSPVLTGLAGLAEMLPYVLTKALSGPFIDRLGARRIAIACDWLSAAAVSIVPLLYWSGILSFWLLLPAVALLGVLRAPSDAAKQALVPVVAETGGLSLERVTGILGTSDRLAGTLGAAGAGMLITLLGSGPALLANAFAFIVSALALTIGMRATAVPPKTDLAPQNYLAQMSEGWAAFTRDPILVTLVVTLAFVGLFDQAYATVLLPVWVRSSGLDASWVGILLAVFSGAAIAGAASGAFFAERLPRLLMYVIGFTFAGPVPMATLAFTPPLWLIVSILLLCGFAAGFLNPIIGAMLFERISKAAVGRVIALVGSLTWVLIPFGGIYAGLLTNAAGILTALGITALLYAVATLSPAAIRRFRAIGQRPIAQPVT
ncbi:MAG: MFS transporter [Devosia sp.]